MGMDDQHRRLLAEHDRFRCRFLCGDDFGHLRFASVRTGQRQRVRRRPLRPLPVISRRLHLIRQGEIRISR